MATKAANDPSLLMPLTAAIRQEIPNKKFNPSTPWRWMHRGLEGLDGKRIYLQVWYVGREPHTTGIAIRAFLEAVTEARLARLRQTQQRAADVTEDELEAAGLVAPAVPRRRSSKKCPDDRDSTGDLDQGHP